MASLRVWQGQPSSFKNAFWSYSFGVLFYFSFSIYLLLDSFFFFPSFNFLSFSFCFSLFGHDKACYYSYIIQIKSFLSILLCFSQPYSFYIFSLLSFDTFFLLRFFCVWVIDAYYKIFQLLLPMCYLLLSFSFFLCSLFFCCI